MIPISDPLVIGGLQATMEFRYLIKKDGTRVLQQLFIETRYPRGAVDDLGFFEWQDIPEVKEEDDTHNSSD